MKATLRDLVAEALDRARASGDLDVPPGAPIVVETPREDGHGDLATNVALTLAKAAKRAPREIAQTILSHISDPDGLIESIEIAGPGFLNIKFSAGAWRSRLLGILDAGDAYGGSELGSGQRVQVEFVSANPTGPLHIGHGRGAATGDALARILVAAGYDVEREYYVNDAGVQMRVLGASVRARYLAALGHEVTFPEDGYPGEYIGEVAARLIAEHGERWVGVDEDQAVEEIGEVAGLDLLEVIRTDLAGFSVSFDQFTSERALKASGGVEAALEELRAAGFVYDKDGAVWFESTRFGDDKDRTVIKSDGQLTYFASDIAYHREKFLRGYDRVIDVWGADHHGYIKRVKASLAAFGKDPESFATVLVQMVNLTRDGEPVRMGKRTGEFISLASVVDEVGPDLARFFFLMRKSDAQLEFDLELARRQTAENPVFYVQYAHTRIAGIFRQAAEKGVVEPSASLEAVARLENSDEIALIKMLDDFPNVVEGAARSLEPHRVVFYAQKLAGEFHRFYTRNRCVSDDLELTAGRLLLVRAVKQVIGRALTLVGVSAPERM